jgi:hypothetical protein
MYASGQPQSSAERATDEQPQRRLARADIPGALRTRSTNEIKASEPRSTPEPQTLSNSSSIHEISAPPETKAQRAENPIQRQPYDVLKLQQVINLSPIFRAPGIEPASALPAGTRVLADVEMDRLSVTVVRDGEALGTGGVATCWAVCARGQNTLGQTVIALGHFSSVPSPAEIAQAFESGMRNANSDLYRVFIVGGLVSLERHDQPTDEIETGTSWKEGKALISAMRNNVVSVRLGTSETDPTEDRNEDWTDYAPSTGRPTAVEVVITATQVFVAPDHRSSGVKFFETVRPATSPVTTYRVPEKPDDPLGRQK